MTHPETRRPLTLVAPREQPRAWLAGLVLALVLAAAAWAVLPAAAETPPEPALSRRAPLPPIQLELPREWRRWLPPPITFDHMFRKDPDAAQREHLW